MGIVCAPLAIDSHQMSHWPLAFQAGSGRAMPLWDLHIQAHATFATTGTAGYVDAGNLAHHVLN
jgi:hypothetical protein